MTIHVKILTLLVFAINLISIHGTTFNEHFISSNYFVDKSLLLKEFFGRFRRTFISAPPGFGQTTNLKMVKKFCQMQFDRKDTIPIPWKETNAYEIFKPLKISKYSFILSKHLAQHPVIFLDLKLDIEDGKFEDKQHICQKYRIMLTNAVSEHKNLIFHLIQNRGQFESENMTNKFAKDYHLELDILSRLVKGENLDVKCDHNLDRIIFRDCIGFLGKILHEYYNSSVVLLIDNYDYIVRKSFIDSKGQIDFVSEFLGENILTILQDNPTEIGFVMVASVTTLGFHSFGLDKYLTGYYFYDDHPYTPFYGLTQEEIDDLLGKFHRDDSNSTLIKCHCNGYETRTRFQSIYNTSCAVDYLNGNSQISYNYQASTDPGNFLSKLLDEPEYLDQFSRLLKHCPTRHGSHEFISFPQFCHFVQNNFRESKFISGVNCTPISFLVQQGFLSPIVGRYAFHIPNQPTRHRFISDMEYFYEKTLNIDLNLIGSHLYDIFVSIKANDTKSTQSLDQYLSYAFKQLKPLSISNESKSKNQANRTKKIKQPKNHTTGNRTNQIGKLKPLNLSQIQAYVNQTEASQKFIHQSIIHLGALENPSLKVIEDYPLPISYEKSTANVDRRSVTCITHDNLALIIKTTDRATLKVSEDRARRYYKYSQPGIDQVWYLTIHVDEQKNVLSSITRNVINVPKNGTNKNRTKKKKSKSTTQEVILTTIEDGW